MNQNKKIVNVNLSFVAQSINVNLTKIKTAKAHDNNSKIQSLSVDSRNYGRPPPLGRKRPETWEP
jgi:hypothetical protein